MTLGRSMFFTCPLVWRDKVSENLKLNVILRFSMRKSLVFWGSFKRWLWHMGKNNKEFLDRKHKISFDWLLGSNNGLQQKNM